MFVWRQGVICTCVLHACTRAVGSGRFLFLLLGLTLILMTCSHLGQEMAVRLWCVQRGSTSSGGRCCWPAWAQVAPKCCTLFAELHAPACCTFPRCSMLHLPWVACPGLTSPRLFPLACRPEMFETAIKESTSSKSPPSECPWRAAAWQLGSWAVVNSRAVNAVHQDTAEQKDGPVRKSAFLSVLLD